MKISVLGLGDDFVCEGPTYKLNTREIDLLAAFFLGALRDLFGFRARAKEFKF